MATEPNDLRRTTLRRLQEKLAADVALANNLCDVLTRYALHTLQMTTGIDMRNSKNLVAAKNELLQNC
nr:hypothetical protein [Tanacetum cinerariifolium]